MKKIATIVPYMFDGYLIIALDQSWINEFNKIPTFSAMIDDDNHLHIISEEVIQYE